MMLPRRLSAARAKSELVRPTTQTRDWQYRVRLFCTLHGDTYRRVFSPIEGKSLGDAWAELHPHSGQSNHVHVSSTEYRRHPLDEWRNWWTGKPDANLRCFPGREVCPDLSLLSAHN